MGSVFSPPLTILLSDSPYLLGQDAHFWTNSNLDPFHLLVTRSFPIFSYQQPLGCTLDY